MMQNSIETRGNLCNELGRPVTVLAYESIRATNLYISGSSMGFCQGGWRTV